jgi:hypothetical protein
MTNFERIKTMSIDELAEFVSNGKYPALPHSPCYVCKYDDGLNCIKQGGCDDEYQKQVYKEWLEKECTE